jgi:outer membrane lipoprotein-sorting protein
MRPARWNGEGMKATGGAGKLAAAMKTAGTRRVAVAIAALALAMGMAGHATRAQEKLPTVEQVLDKYVTALGGKAAIQKVKSRVTTGTFEVPQDSLQGTATFYAKAPNKRRYSLEVPGFGTIEQCFDGTVGWASNPQLGVRDLSEQELEQERVSADFYAALNIRTTFSGLMVKGKEMVGEREAFVLEGKEKAGGPRVMYFDSTTGLLIRATVERDSAEGKVTVESFLDDYREVDGVKVPHMLTQVQPDLRLIIRVNEVKSNAPVEDAVFAKPQP